MGQGIGGNEDEQIWVVIHITPNTRNLPEELSLSQTSKNTTFFLLSFMFFLNKIGEQEGKTGSARRWG
jgi:hypothetical protein